MKLDPESGGERIPTASTALATLREVNALEGVDRAGYAMSGIERPESVAAHTLGVLAAAFLVAEMVEESVDRGRLALLVLLHDLGEARVGDTPMPAKGPEDEERERRAMEEILVDLPPSWREAWEEVLAGETTEARIVKGCDKLQLMAKVLDYERQGRGNLAAFWDNEGNFRDGGVPAIRAVYGEILRERRDGSLRRGGASPPPGRS